MIVYLFVYDSTAHTFVERFWVAGSPAATRCCPPEADLQDRCVQHEDAEAAITRLRARYPRPRYAVSRMAATSWQVVEDNFHGLHYHELE